MDDYQEDCSRAMTSSQMPGADEDIAGCAKVPTVLQSLHLLCCGHKLAGLPKSCPKMDCLARAGTRGWYQGYQEMAGLARERR